MQRTPPASVGPTGLPGRILRFPPTRIALALLFVVGGGVLATSLVLDPVRGALGVGDDGSLLGVLLAVVQILVALLAYAAYVRLIERRPVDELALHGAPKELGAGAVLGAALFVVTIGVVWALGAYGFTGANGAGAVLAPLATALVAGFVEEIVFRGVLFRIAEEVLGSWIALASTAVLFGALHLVNPDATLQGAVAIMLTAGVLLGAAYMLTKRLWLAIGLHAAWNFAQGGVLGVSVSGTGAEGLLRGGPSGPDLVSGGVFGVEASVVAIMVCAVASAFLLARASRKGNIVARSWYRRGSKELGSRVGP